MKLSTIIFCFLFALQASSQTYINLDSARKLSTSTNPERRFRGLRTMDRYYYTRGLFDSSERCEKDLFAIATDLGRDSMKAIVYRGIGNRYVVKTDYNFSIVNYAKGLEYTTSADTRRAGLYLNLAYVYITTGNNEVALDYIRRGHVIGHAPENLFFESMLLGMVCNNLGKGDSALFYFRQAENLPIKIADPLLLSVFMQQNGRAYELTGDKDLTETYYKKAMTFANEKSLPMSIIRTGNAYCNFLMNEGNYDEAKRIALEDLDVARKAGINEGISTVADVLRKVYLHSAQKDSIILYAQLQMDYKDSVSNQKKQSEFQNITFLQQLKEIDEQTKAELADEQRKANIQYALIALGIIGFIIFFLLLSRRFITNLKLIQFLSVLALLIVFEFLNLVLHPFLERATRHSPVLMLIALVCIASLLVPLHHRLERWATHILVEKNKKARLIAAKKTIEQLEGDPKIN